MSHGKKKTVPRRVINQWLALFMSYNYRSEATFGPSIVSYNQLSIFNVHEHACSHRGRFNVAAAPHDPIILNKAAAIPKHTRN